jgi:hypothetical protein
MNPTIWLTLLATNMLSFSIGWALCCHHIARDNDVATQRRTALDAEARRAVDRLHELRDRLRAIERALIHWQLVLEQRDELRASRSPQ